MGTYVVYCNHEKKEYIEPGDIDRGAIKTNQVAYRTDLGRLLIHLLSYGYDNTWPNVVQISDGEYGYETVHETYTDVTKEAVSSYNNVWLCEPNEAEEEEFKQLKLQYTPDLL